MKHADGVDELVHQDHVEAGGLEGVRALGAKAVSLRKCDFRRLLYLRKCDFASLLPDQSGQLSSSQPEELGVRENPCFKSCVPSSAGLTQLGGDEGPWKVLGPGRTVRSAPRAVLLLVAP